MVSPGCKANQGHNLSLLATSGWSANDAHQPMMLSARSVLDFFQQTPPGEPMTQREETKCCARPRPVPLLPGVGDELPSRAGDNLSE